MTSQPSRFWDRMASRYARMPVADEVAYQKKLEMTRSHLHPDMDVLEFGCGTGSTALVHAPYVRHIRAIDFSAKMIEIAQGKAAAAGVTNISFECAGIDDLQVADQSYDVVLGLSILHLLSDKEAVIAKVHRMLKPGGLFVSSTACISDMALPIRMILPVGRFLRLFPLVKAFSGRDLTDSLTGAGFTIADHWQPGKNKAVFIIAAKPV